MRSLLSPMYSLRTPCGITAKIALFENFRKILHGILPLFPFWEPHGRNPCGLRGIPHILSRFSFLGYQMNTTNWSIHFGEISYIVSSPYMSQFAIKWLGLCGIPWNSLHSTYPAWSLQGHIRKCKLVQIHILFSPLASFKFGTKLLRFCAEFRGFHTEFSSSAWKSSDSARNFVDFHTESHMIFHFGHHMVRRRVESVEFRVFHACPRGRHGGQ